MEELKKDKQGNLTLDGFVVKVNLVGEKKIKLSLLGCLSIGDMYKKTCIEVKAPEQANAYLIKDFQDLSKEDRELQVIFYKI